MFGLSLVGVLDTIHLYVQKQFGFNKGCLGFIDSAIEQSFNCKQVVSSEAGTILGISNTYLGIIFYLLITLLLIARLYNHKKLRPLVNRLITSGLLLAFIYAGYLVYYQYAVLGEYCLLCLVSAVLVALMFILEMVRYFVPEGNPNSTGKKQFESEIYWRSFIVCVVILIGLVDLLLAHYQTPDAVPAEESFQTALIPDSLVLYSARSLSFPVETASCGELTSTSETSDESLISFYDPILGSPNSRISITVYFDPAHKSTIPLLAAANDVLEKWDEQLEIAFKPIALSKSSVPYVEAIYELTSSGQFSQFTKVLSETEKIDSSTGQLTVMQIQIALHETGIDTSKLDSQRTNDLIHSRIYMEKEKAQAFDIETVPAIFINGKRLPSRELSRPCIFKAVQNAFDNLES